MAECSLYIYKHIFQIYSGITSGRVLNGELSYAKTLEVNLFAFGYRLFHGDFSPVYRFQSAGQSPVGWREILMKQSVGKCK